MSAAFASGDVTFPFEDPGWCAGSAILMKLTTGGALPLEVNGVSTRSIDEYGISAKLSIKLIQTKRQLMGIGDKSKWITLSVPVYRVSVTKPYVANDQWRIDLLSAWWNSIKSDQENAYGEYLLKIERSMSTGDPMYATLLEETFTYEVLDTHSSSADPRVNDLADADWRKRLGITTDPNDPKYSGGLLGGMKDMFREVLEFLFIPSDNCLDEFKDAVSDLGNWGPFTLYKRLTERPTYHLGTYASTPVDATAYVIPVNLPIFGWYYLDLRPWSSWIAGMRFLLSCSLYLSVALGIWRLYSSKI